MRKAELEKQYGALGIHVSFSRALDVTKRLPSRAEMLSWIRAASDRPLCISIRFAGEEEMAKLNLGYRGREGPTNVLTFDYVHEPEARADIAVCIPVIEAEAAAQGKSFRAHFAHMLVHSVLHAEGWDHETDEEAEAMEAKEAGIMAAIGFPNPYSDRARGH